MEAVGRSTKSSRCWPRAAKMIAKTTRRIRDPRMPEDYSRSRVVIMMGLTSGAFEVIAGGRTASVLPLVEPATSPLQVTKD
ncbi:hypothetical protein AYJ54_17895 [Bradyrhizobium centrolobii]|uniref:Uncharacterized protein n=1 Tax=Bradyrhizobium centrolobii TaxID=1505087 RepID=A0A176YMD5_9BRAD|nr:hypothetical protein AYJ54_17895 [Bradyrhizobium centrolobii]